MDMGIRVRVWRKEIGESLVRRKWKRRVDGSHSEFRGSFLMDRKLWNSHIELNLPDSTILIYKKMLLTLCLFLG